MSTTVDLYLSELSDHLLLLSRSQEQLTGVLKAIRTPVLHEQPLVPGPRATAPMTRSTGAAGDVVLTAADLPSGLPDGHLVRVAPRQVPHRTTKRNYDYFGKLESELAALRSARATDPTR
jgi:hypothetical protein